MRKIIAITANDLRLFLSARSNLVSLLLVPSVMTVILGFGMGGGFGGTTPTIRVDVIDHDQSDLSADFVEAIHTANDSLTLCPMDNDASDICVLNDSTLDRALAEDRLKESDTLAALIIPAGFETDVKTFDPVQVTYLSVQDFTAPGYIQQAVNTAVLRINGAAIASRLGGTLVEEVGSLSVNREDFEAAVYENAAAVWAEDPIGLDYQLANVEQAQALDVQEGFGQSVPGIGSMYVLFTVLGGMTALVGERQQGTLQRLATMPVSRGGLLGGKILARFFLGMLQYVVIFSIGILVGLDFGSDLLALLLLMFTFTLAATALSFAAGTFMQNEAQAGGMGLLMALVLAPLGGAWWPLEIVPSFMQTLGHISPIAWVMDAFNILMFQDGGLADIWLSLLVLTGLALTFFLFAIWQFKYEGEP